MKLMGLFHTGALSFKSFRFTVTIKVPANIPTLSMRLMIMGIEAITYKKRKKELLYIIFWKIINVEINVLQL